jgi:general secretion pathway protein E
VDPQALDDLSLLFEARPRLIVLPERDVRTAIRRVYGSDPLTAEQLLADLPVAEGNVRPVDLAVDDLLSMANEAPVVRLVNMLLVEALDVGASDVHLEAYADNLRARYRVDGVLQDAPSLPKHLVPAVISRLKIMAELDIAERRKPQDGRIRLRLQNRQVDVRVSIIPTLHGESIVLRLLDKENYHVRLAELGMSDDTRKRFEEAIGRPHGIVLATGPTGSGKTTTLYAAIEHIRTGREKILTVEDPVEYELPGVPQVPVRERVGVTFASALRSLLRQDPDVLLVGEIRDQETAEIAVHAALTNDAPSAITRLLDLGVPAYLVASTVEAVLAQRLVRLVCQDCADRRGTDCATCRNSGFRGRTGIYELMLLDEELRSEIQMQRGTSALRSLARAHGMTTLVEDGERLVRSGVTTAGEVARVTRA